MRNPARPAVFLLAAAVAACVGQTPYRPAEDGYGYSEQKLESNRYRVNFAGNSSTKQQTVENYVLYRAAELTLKEGYDWFVLSDRSTNAERKESSGMVVSFGGFGWGHRYGHGFGIAHPVGGDSTTWQANVEVLMRKGKKPEDNPNAFNAHEIKANLEPVIERPPPPEAER